MSQLLWDLMLTEEQIDLVRSLVYSRRAEITRRSRADHDRFENAQLDREAERCSSILRQVADRTSA